MASQLPGFLCINEPCVSPRCKGAAWVATSNASTDVEAFKAEVVAYMKRTGRRDVGKCCAIVFAAAQAEPCLFS